MRVYEYRRSDLVLISVFLDSTKLTKEARELAGHRNELAKAICSNDRLGRFTQDYHGPVHTGGGNNGFAVLIELAFLDRWRAVVKSYGCRIEAYSSPEDGHYGDRCWKGVDIVSVPNSSTYVYWISR